MTAYTAAMTSVMPATHQLPTIQAVSVPRAPMMTRNSTMMRIVLRLFFAMAEYMGCLRYVRWGAEVSIRRCAATRPTGDRSELHAGRLGDRGGIRHLEELALGESEPAHEERVREDLDLGVELAYAAVVEATRRLDLVFGVDELALQLQEVLVRLQLRVGLGHREDRLHRRLELVLGHRGFGGCRGAHRGGACGGHLLEDAL